MKSSKKTKVIKNRFKLRPIEEKARRGRVTETEKALTGFLDELKNVYCDNCEAINPNQYVVNKTFIYDMIQKAKFHTKDKNKYYDNVKKFNNIVTIASRLLGYDFSPFKARRTSKSLTAELVNFALERQQVISMEDVKKYLKMV